MADGARVPGAFAALRSALSRPAVWSSIWATELALALAPAILYATWLGPELDHRVAPRALFQELDTIFRFDHRAEIAQLDGTIEQLGALLVIVAMFVGAFAAGGWLTLFLSGSRRRGLGEFVTGGARFFGRFARLIVCTGFLLALVTWLCKGAPWNHVVLRGIAGVPVADFDKLETLPSESHALLLRQIQACVYGLGVALVLTWGDFTRTRIALFDARSVVWAGLESAFLLVRHPLRALRPMIVLFVVEAAIVTGLGFASRAVESGALGGAAGLERGITSSTEVVALLLLGQLALLWRVVLRGSRYAAAVSVSRALVTPIARPDPWRWGRLPGPDPDPHAAHDRALRHAPVAS